MDHNKNNNNNHGTPNQHTGHKPISKGDLLSSAKVVAEAAKTAMGSEKEKKMDKGKVAGAAADILGAACQYGKLEEKSYGKYVGKAEDYLHQYQSKTNNTNTTSGGHSGPATTTNADHGQSGGGFGDYIKMAEGVLKHKEEGSGGGGGGYGDYVKMAEGLFKK